MKGFENDGKNEYRLSEKGKVNDTIMKTNSRDASSMMVSMPY